MKGGGSGNENGRGKAAYPAHVCMCASLGKQIFHVPPAFSEFPYPRAGPNNWTQMLAFYTGGPWVPAGIHEFGIWGNDLYNVYVYQCLGTARPKLFNLFLHNAKEWECWVINAKNFLNLEFWLNVDS